jgi:hypothetical protein
VPDGSHAVPYTHPSLVAGVVEQLIASNGAQGGVDWRVAKAPTRP